MVICSSSTLLFSLSETCEHIISDTIATKKKKKGNNWFFNILRFGEGRIKSTGDRRSEQNRSGGAEIGKYKVGRRRKRIGAWRKGGWGEEKLSTERGNEKRDHLCVSLKSLKC